MFGSLLLVTNITIFLQHAQKIGPVKSILTLHTTTDDSLKEHASSQPLRTANSEIGNMAAEIFDPVKC
jgi:hypothetical protein